MPDPTLHWGVLLSDDASEVLRDLEADAVGGDSDWRLGAVYLHELPDGLDTGELRFPPGTYLRTVYGNDVRSYQVHGDARAYVDTIERTWLAETDG